MCVPLLEGLGLCEVVSAGLSGRVVSLVGGCWLFGRVVAGV